jgi:hypothetical protein
MSSRGSLHQSITSNKISRVSGTAGEISSRKDMVSSIKSRPSRIMSGFPMSLMLLAKRSISRWTLTVRLLETLGPNLTRVSTSSLLEKAL